jgi:hypothetical protein
LEKWVARIHRRKNPNPDPILARQLTQYLSLRAAGLMCRDAMLCSPTSARPRQGPEDETTKGDRRAECLSGSRPPRLLAAVISL